MHEQAYECRWAHSPRFGGEIRTIVEYRVMRVAVVRTKCRRYSTIVEHTRRPQQCRQTDVARTYGVHLMYSVHGVGRQTHGWIDRSTKPKIINVELSPATNVTLGYIPCFQHPNQSTHEQLPFCQTTLAINMIIFPRDYYDSNFLTIFQT